MSVYIQRTDQKNADESSPLNTYEETDRMPIFVSNPICRRLLWLDHLSQSHWTLSRFNITEIQKTIQVLIHLHFSWSTFLRLKSFKMNKNKAGATPPAASVTTRRKSLGIWIFKQFQILFFKSDCQCNCFFSLSMVQAASQTLAKSKTKKEYPAHPMNRRSQSQPTHLDSSTKNTSQKKAK